MSAWSLTWRIYLGLWALTAAAAATAASSDRLATVVRHADRLSLTPGQPRSAGTIAAIAAHNLVVTGWPALLAALGLARWRFAWLFDVVVAASAVANGCVVGAAVGAYGVALVPWLVHLPIEWGALAAGVGAWSHARCSKSRRSRCVYAQILLCVAAAAAVEVDVTP